MHKISSISLLIIILLGFQTCKPKQVNDEWNQIFKKHETQGTFVLKKKSKNNLLVHNLLRSETDFVPASTFKILNSLIALQTSAISHVNDTIKWDGITRSFKSWNRDHSMKSAFSVSCVWFYQELARRIGETAMQEWLNKSNYGNKKIEKAIDRFWLDGNLEISAKEQVSFLENLIDNNLPFKTGIQESVKKIMITDSSDAYTIHSKTGWSNKIGWNVGYIETDKDIWIFAMNIDMDDIKDAKKRKLITYDILREQSIIE